MSENTVPDPLDPSDPDSLAWRVIRALHRYPSTTEGIATLLESNLREVIMTVRSLNFAGYVSYSALKGGACP